ncbi:MAG: amidohydrolase family protein [Acidimicrobiia bacterium]
MTAELAIRGGTVVDGTGAPGFVGDVAIEGGRITEIGPDLHGYRELDATGAIVAPGFIDIHTHYDAQVLWDSALTPSCWHGVTTVIAGNCGFSLAPCRPQQRELLARTLEHVEAMSLDALHAGISWDFETFPEYLAAVRRRGTLLNFGAFVGHTAVRLFVMGDEAYERAATESEVNAMQAVVADALESGAIGFSTSLNPAHQGAEGRPVPSRFADAAEVRALLEVPCRAGRGVVQILPGEGVTLDDVFDAAPDLECPIVFSEVLTRADGEHQRRLERLLSVRRHGADNLWGLMAVHPIVFRFHLRDPFPFDMLPEFARLHARPARERVTCYSDPEWRRVVQEELDRRAGYRWDAMYFEETSRTELVGRTVADVAAERSMSPIDTMFTTALDEDLATRFRVVILNDDRQGIDALLQSEGLLVGLSDAGAHATQLCDAGFAATLLGTFVRERCALSVEEGVYKLTGQPAAAFGIPGRGILQPGFAADIAVFDPVTVDPGPLRRVWDFPADSDRLVADQPEGIVHVVVNGTVIRESGHSVEAATLDRYPGEPIAPARAP